MKTADEVLAEHGIKPPSGKLSDNFYTTCPHCSAGRSPAHREANCLHVKVTKDGVVWFCNHCPWKGGETFKANGRDRGREEFIAVYYYPDDDGVVKARKVRPRSGKPKCFWQHLDHRGEWVKTKGDAPRLLYRLPELREALANVHPVLIVEGEKDVDSAYRIGLPATCNPDGATGEKWRRADSEVLRGADIVIIPDHDEEGYKHANLIAQTSRDTAKRVRMLTLAKHWPECPKGGDISDWLAAGHTGEELAKLIEAAPDYVPEQGAKPEGTKKESASGNGIDDAAELEALAQLAPLDYERARKDAGKRLGISRLSLLDALVKAKRADLGLDGDDDDKQGRAIEFPTPEPWPNPVNGAELLDDIAAALKRYVIMAEHARHVTALWDVHTYLLDCFLISPRLAIRSPMKRCGKTTLLDVLGWLVWHSLPTANVSAAALFRVVEGYRPTLLVDEADTFLGEADELRGVLNSGHRKGGQVLRTVGDDYEPRAFATYSAVAIGIIGNLPDTLADRSITVDLKRKLPSEAAESFRVDRVGHLEVLARKTARWAADNAARIAAADPAMPDALFNREADNWRPLFAIAEAAGGEWPQRVREAATKAAVGGEAASGVELLLGDIRDILAARRKNKVEPVDRIPSEDLVKALVANEGRPWAELGKARKPLTQNRLARMLKPLGIGPGNIGPETARVRGYVREHFEEAFERYLAPEGTSEPPIRPERDEISTSDAFQSAQPSPGCAVGKSEKPNNDGLLCGCAVEKGESGQSEHEEGSSLQSVTFFGTEPFASCAHCGKTDGVIHHVRDNRHLDRPSLNLHEACVDPWFARQENGQGEGLSQRTITELAEDYTEAAYRRANGGADVDFRTLDADLRRRLAEMVLPEFIEVEFDRVMAEVFRA